MMTFPDANDPSVERLSTLLARFEAERPEVSRTTGEELLSVVDRYPEVAGDRAALFARWVDAGSPEVREWALRTLTSLALDRPDVVRDHVEPVREVLGDRTAVNRDEAAAVLAVLARTHPVAVTPAVPSLHDLLNEPGRSGRVQALLALEAVAAADLHAVVPAFRGICRLLESDDEAVRELATACVATAGVEDPLVVERAGRRFTDRLADPVVEVRARAYHAAVGVALSYPGAFEFPAEVADALEERQGELGGPANDTIRRATTALRALAR